MPRSLNGQTFYTTTEACELAGTNRNTFLRWIREGLFTDVEHRDRNGWRLFTGDDIYRLRDRVNGVSKTDVKKNRFDSAYRTATSSTAWRLTEKALVKVEV